MKKTMTLTAALLSGFILLSSACAKSVEVENPEQADNARIYHATVKSVHDGDTIRVTDSHGREIRIRMAYIDAPELNQAHGQSSRDALRTVLQRQNVQIEIFDTDQYGRQVARVLLNGRDVNLQQIQQGNAWHYRSIARRNQNPADYAQYERSEAAAKQQRAGLWRDRSPVAPWTYRQQQRRNEQ